MNDRPKHKKQTDAQMLTAAISLVAHEVCRLREQMETEFEWRKSHHEKPRVRFQFAIGMPQNKPKENSMPVAVKLTNEQKVKVTLTPVTDTGKPAKLDGAPTWEVVSGNATVVVDEGGMSATLVSADDPGDTQFLVKADADIGEGVEEISDVITLNVVGATAKNLGLTVGTPEAK